MNRSDLYNFITTESDRLRIQAMAPPKAFSYLASPFNTLVESYKLNGYQLPLLFYTDNVNSNRAFLEGVLPSLLKNDSKAIVCKPANIEEQPSNDYGSSLPALVLPNAMGVLVFSDSEKTNLACQNILDNLEDHPEYLSFNCEWIARYHGTFNVGLRKTQASLNEVLLIQLCYKSKTYLFRTFEFTEDDFPGKLRYLLKCENVKNVNGNFLRLQKGYKTNSKGIIELGTFYKDRGIIEKRSLSLAKVCAVVLKSSLPKNK
ncbi:hypothetical protein BCV72DRAFT_241026 [Rhizopus microsporus var. microsporus]|uniref:Uncharacterized protein n=2 Tax=Rhizopus microsporus TaxID=58291 RepID=A0A2G4SL17_RHIZD|nr:uncharacterized protein RHIMIDRAFT_299880 [Rhizopus microsporus ATCC 52813]ORE07737.1 hypothetical protein BCV72DRAFT_241026 [Rhizopus microsporus var. microsporus]PHZ09459.1 hypothetical protein RHIMIDRAFT_299880 [Rhizopus microsporus ATCC 52813]